jgi:hypothetical protein
MKLEKFEKGRYKNGEFESKSNQEIGNIILSFNFKFSLAKILLL